MSLLRKQKMRLVISKINSEKYQIPISIAKSLNKLNILLLISIVDLNFSMFENFSSKSFYLEFCLNFQMLIFFKPS